MTGTFDRTYVRTHPWITFQADLRQAPPALWMLLGEAASKSEHIAGVPLQPDVAQRLHQLYLAKGVLATTAIEGNTLSQEQVERHLEGKLELPPSKQYLAREIENIVRACNQIGEEVIARGAIELTPEQIKRFNAQVLSGLAMEEGGVAGEYRAHAVGVARYRGAPAEDCEYLVERLCRWINGPEFQPVGDSALAVAVLKAVIMHLYIAWIHPFGDGNGRTARLVEFQLLVSAGVPTPAAHLLSNHYNETRTEYYRRLDEASRSGGDVIPFILYAVQGFVDELRSQLELVKRQQLKIAWEHYVHKMLPVRTSSEGRRLRLVLDLSDQAEPVPKSQIPRMSARVAELYAKKTTKTLTRDVNALLDMKLLRKEAGGYVSNRESILAFLPARAKRSDPGGGAAT